MTAATMKKLISAVMSSHRRSSASLTVEAGVAEVRRAADRADEAADEVGRERRDDGAERGADDDGDGQVDDVPAQEEVTEALEHGPVFAAAGGIPCGRGSLTPQDEPRGAGSRWRVTTDGPGPLRMPCMLTSAIATHGRASRRRRRRHAVAVALALAASPSPAQADPFDYLMPPPGACNEYGGTSLTWQAFVGECLANEVRRNAGRTRLTTTGAACTSPPRPRPPTPWPCPSGDPHYACGRPTDHHLVRRNYRTTCPSGRYAENIYRRRGRSPLDIGARKRAA